jgi:DNA-binding response OmpR family regulator
MLPGLLDGADITKEIRANGIRTPIILLTAKDKIGDRVEGLNAGADDYLVKPFAFEELLARVRALMRRPQDHVGNVLQIDDLTLDTNTYEVKRSGRRVQLSQREYALLEYFLRNQNRILSKSNIISHVWDYDADILPNTLEVYIGYLRGKIERPFKGPELIHTVRGFGYKLSIESA